MQSDFMFPRAIFFDFQTVWIVPFVFAGQVIAFFARSAFQSNIYAHFIHPFAICSIK
jgi:hypothetical protein